MANRAYIELEIATALFNLPEDFLSRSPEVNGLINKDGIFLDVESLEEYFLLAAEKCRKLITSCSSQISIYDA